MTIDLIITQPNNVPFPLWSKWLIDNAHRFNTIYIALHVKNIPEYDFTDLIQELLKDVKNVVWIEGINPMDGSDWRNVAINRCLDLSTAENVLFMEQDFFIKNTESFFNLYGLNEFQHVCGFKRGNRLHPAFLFVPRQTIERSSRDFSPVEEDHFGKFTREIMSDDQAYFCLASNLSNEDLWFHMNGLTSNYTLVEMNQPPNHDLANFLLYNRKAREVILKLTTWEKADRYIDLTFKAEKLACPLGQYLEEYE